MQHELQLNKSSNAPDDGGGAFALELEAAGATAESAGELTLEPKKSDKSAFREEDARELADEPVAENGNAAGAEPSAKELAEETEAASAKEVETDEKKEEVEDPPNASPKKPSPLVWLAAGASQDVAAAGAPHASPPDAAASNAAAAGAGAPHVSPPDDVSPHASAGGFAIASTGAAAAVADPAKASPNAGLPHASVLDDPHESGAAG